VTGSLNYDGNFDWGEGIISAGTYRLSVSGFGGDAAESFQIQLNREFPLVCTADINADGLLNFFDVAAYIVRYNSNDPAADLTAPFGTLNFFDMSSFITLYNAGCP
jgi:hypothetical protein